MRLSHTLLALTLSMSPPGLSLAGNCPDKNDQENTIAQQVQAATSARAGSTLGFTLSHGRVPLMDGAMAAQADKPETVARIIRERAYVADRITSQEGGTVLVPGVVAESAAITLRENPGQVPAVFVRLDTLKNRDRDLGRGNIELKTGGGQVGFALVPGKQVRSFTLDGKRYTLALDYAPAQ